MSKRDEAIERRIAGLVGTLSDREWGYLLGRYSAIRLTARAHGTEAYLPDPPPIELDPTIQRAAEEAARQQRRREGRYASKFRGVPRSKPLD